MTLRVRAEARDNLLDAARWYQGKGSHLGMAFVAEIDRVFDRIADGPLRYRVMYRGVRRALARRFPNAIFFVIEADEIFVLAVLHQSRDRKVLNDRLDA
jgi:toxin ParE1/3/4